MFNPVVSASSTPQLSEGKARSVTPGSVEAPQRLTSSSEPRRDIKFVEEKPKRHRITMMNTQDSKGESKKTLMERVAEILSGMRSQKSGARIVKGEQVLMKEDDLKLCRDEG